MDLIHAIILSIIEGITEFLPISSTGHLEIASRLLSIPNSDFLSSFEIIIQFGAILAVVVLYWQKIINSQKLWKNILAAFIPTAIIGFILYHFIKTFLLTHPIVAVFSLLIGGILLILFETFIKTTHAITTAEKLTLKQSIIIGLCQSLAIIPGVSRSAATIVSGLYLGLSREAAVEFSFILAVPTMVAASGYDLLKSGFSFSSQEYILLLIGLVGSFITALLAIKFFLTFIQKHTFITFGVYRILIALLFLFLLK